MFDLETAKTWHRVFALHLEFVIEGIEVDRLEAGAISDSRACRLGQWMHGEACRPYIDFQSFRSLDQAHTEFHQLAGDMVSAYLANGEGARKMIESGRFREISQAVLLAIDAFQGELRRRKMPLPTLDESDETVPRVALWDDSLKVGNPIIDGQREAIVHLVERLTAHPDENLNSDAMSDALSELSRIVGFYLESEESLLRQNGVAPGIVRKRVEEHNQILEECVQIHLDIMAGKLCRVDQVAPLLRSWVRDRFLFGIPTANDKRHDPKN